MSDKDLEILKMLEAHGSNLKLRMVIDFHFALETKDAASMCYDVLLAEGEVVKKFKPGSHQRYQAKSFITDDMWLIECSVNMRPKAKSIDRKRRQIARKLAPFGAISDGWASYGNRFAKRA